MLFPKGLEIQYCPLVPSIEKPIATFTEPKAQQFFEWYIHHIPDRIKYLCELCHLPPYKDSVTYQLEYWAPV